jgi:thiamine-monophosphate kinase
MKTKRREPLGEDALVQRIERKLAGKSKRLAKGLGDDAALWVPSPGFETILTCDWFLEGTHFLRDKLHPDAVGWKCLARAVSDIAAMGGRPGCFLLSLGLPPELRGHWLDKFLGGLRRASQALGCQAAGGDTTRQRNVLISVAVVGEVRPTQALLRSRAKPGDLIYVSGTLGEAELGLRQLRKRKGMARPANAALRKHLYPEPRLALGEWLAKNRLATAMMDLSDGLSTDLARLCRASSVGAQVDVDALPGTSLVSLHEGRELALHGGDDYELLFTVAPRNGRSLPAKFQGLPLTCIGRITKERTISASGEPLLAAGWDPFRSS